MIINSNLASNNTLRQMSVNESSTQKALAKLSSGLKINSAADDAAGLSISEKMRGQISGLNKATSNAQDGISMVGTAEGSLAETTSILQRMRELAVQASTDTNTTVDRSAMQTEMNQLTSEVNRIGNTTSFNTQKLLNGGGASPTNSTSAVAFGNGLDIGALTGGTGVTSATGTQAKEVITFVDLAGAAGANDGKNMSITIGGRALNVVLDSTAANSGVSGNTITLKQDTGATKEAQAADLANQLTNVINSDDNLKGKYTATVPAVNNGVLTVTAVGATFDAKGVLSGALDNGSVTAAAGTATKGSIVTAGNIVATAAVGSHAQTSIDFTNATTESLKGTGIVVDGKTVDFFDSADGAYKGTSDFAVDLNGVRTPDKIVSAIVSALAGTAGAAVAASGGDNQTDAVFAATNSAFANVNLSASADGNKLLVTASATGEAGNVIQMGNNGPVKVTNTYTNAKLTGSAVDSAQGLADGNQTVTITNVAASVKNQFIATGQGAATITMNDTSAESGQYQIVSTTPASSQLQKQDATGNWNNVGATFDGTALTTVIRGDISIQVTGALTATSAATFSVDGNHGNATLTEAGSTTSGAGVRVENGQNSVTLKSADGIGQASVNVGSWDAANTPVGDVAKWSFDTSSKDTTAAVTSGKFEAKLQIGANTGEMMTVSIDDMRSQALGISGTTASATVTASNGSKASLVAVASASNGSDNNNVEFTLDLSTADKATAAISVIDDATAKVSAQRSNLGAVQNRLEHTINNLGTSSQNITTAEANIRDVDMAKEMTNFTKNNILQQASQAMLSQANQQAQGVLQLLR